METQQADVLPILVDMSVDVFTKSINMDQRAGASLQVKWLGSPVGRWVIETSNDPGQNTPPTNWNLYTGAYIAINAAGSCSFHVKRKGFMWMRGHYVATSGSGTLVSALADEIEET